MKRGGRGPGDGRICEAERNDGQPCHSWALPGGLYCLSHDPERREQAREAWSRGATRGNRLRALRGKRSKLATMPELVKFTATVIQDVLAPEDALDPIIARTVLYGLSIQRQLVEAADIDARLRAIEERLKMRPTRSA